MLATWCLNGSKNAEHTWGMDIKTFLHDEGNWTNALFHPMQFTAPNFVAVAGTLRNGAPKGYTFMLSVKEYPLVALTPV